MFALTGLERKSMNCKIKIVETLDFLQYKFKVLICPLEFRYIYIIDRYLAKFLETKQQKE